MLKRNFIFLIIKMANFTLIILLNILRVSKDIIVS